jgi:hypothetical protein
MGRHAAPDPEGDPAQAVAVVRPRPVDPTVWPDATLLERRPDPESSGLTEDDAEQVFDLVAVAYRRGLLDGVVLLWAAALALTWLLA